jgi:Fe-S cluster assembly ATP-binding protein
MLKIKNVSATIGNKTVLSNISLEINPGEIHVIMGPKASGKSTLVHVIQGNPYVMQTEGTIIFGKKNINKLSADKRSKLGIFSSFQYPPDIPGLTNLEVAKLTGENSSLTIFNTELESCYRSLAVQLELGSSFGDNAFNADDSSPSNWRKNEILQMIMANPKIAILDEVDLDSDNRSLLVIANSILSFMNDKTRSCILITNNKVFLDLVNPTHVHVMVDGKIKEQGTTELYKRIIEDGYSQFS